jgi:DNA-binding LacI/PurR family transcriptional regulator
MLPHSSFSLVDSDNFAGGVMATKHLIDQNCRKIGIITGPSDWLVSKQRYDGWKAAHNDAQFFVDQDLVVEGDWSAASGYHVCFSCWR